MYRRVAFLCAPLALLLSGCVGLDFSPDGRNVAITTPRGLVTMPADGGPQQLIPQSDNGYLPLWSPDSQRILFTHQDASSQELMLYETQTRRTRKIGSDLGFPYAWREDGKRFAAIHNPDQKTPEIVWYDLAEGGVVQAAHVSDVPQLMVWLPNTDDVAFLASGPDADVYSVEGGEEKRITKTRDVIGLALSGSGKELLWARRGANLKYQLLSIYRYSLASRSVTRTAFPMRVPLINPDPRRAPESVDYATFSPEGNRLALTAAFQSEKGGEVRQYSACYAMKMDGSEARLVRKTAGNPESASALLPVWSRDGTRLGIYDRQDKQIVVAVFDASGANGKRILNEMAK